jgi:hypothetical protein
LLISIAVTPRPANPLCQPHSACDLGIGIGNGGSGGDRRSNGGGKLAHTCLLHMLKISASGTTLLALAPAGNSC